MKQPRWERFWVDGRHLIITPPPDHVGLGDMTGGEQIRQQTGPGTEGLPGFVVSAPRGPGWYYDDKRGEWRLEAFIGEDKG